MKLVYGGNLSDIPKPHRRWFEDKRRKPLVTVTVTRYHGIGQHYYVRISTENNPIWNSDGACWQNAWDDKDARGYDRDRKFDNPLYAKRFIDRFIRMFFPPDRFKHKIDFLGAATRATWFGKYKEGD